MTKRQKRIKRVIQNPKSVSFKDLESMLLDHGFTVRQPGSGSSHYVYSKGKIQITVPFKRPYVKEIYVKRVLELIGGEHDEEKS